MENTWSDGIAGERKDLTPIMEEEDKGQAKGSQSDSSDAASTIKRWNSRWTPSEGYDSSGTSTNSDVGDEYVEDYPRDIRPDLSEPTIACQTAYRSQECLCQYPTVWLISARRRLRIWEVFRLSVRCRAQGHCLYSILTFILPFDKYRISLNLSKWTSKSYRSLQTDSVSSELAHHAVKEHARNVAHYPHVCHLQQDPIFAKEREIHAGSRTNSTTSLPVSSTGRCAGSLDRRRRRFRSRVDRDQRAMSHSDLICHERDRPHHYCSLQQFHCGSNMCINNYHSKTEERLRKLESERGALHMEVSVLSEQVDAQSNKIQELESVLQEKKDTLRQMEEALQKEVLSRSALETQKLELLTSLSEMKLRQASLEHENLSLRNTSPLSNGERFSRHTGQYSSLPRPPTSKKGVVFAEEAKIMISEASAQVELPPPKPLAELGMEEIGDWLARLGLECYAGELRRWGATGSKLLDATQVQLEKELDIKNALHRKKLLYAIESERSNGAGLFGSHKMDNAAVLRWLDDIGLPQHKEAFHNAKIDGRVLHRLTTEDLLNLGVAAQLHAASLRRGIQVLRDLNFEFDNLERRSVNGNGADGTNVTLWTNHRVMEWLRVVDLAEYAPNMRGSGVHGGLMIHEGRFTSELLATLLSIPPAKTLLRRHLTTHFNQILGREVVQQKREMETTLGFVPLTLTARLKVPKKSQFTLKRKKSKNEMDFGNLVCPLEASPPGTPSTPSSTPGSPNLNSPTF
ncbi:liprin-beta-2 isoform X4 [Temnothorax curvispinosus]|uniref:Liprin-beta-2 isoform X4 n=1 Tax=Temnothorax curvispinosus TaxID=300111 RepID=A0A6J1QPE4_9HYME|nr:liprin-beta-2 isoform X4 [Temnothorax curvispinosus]